MKHATNFLSQRGSDGTGHTIAAKVLLFSLFVSVMNAGAVDLTGTWESTYSFGPVDEVMTSKILLVDGQPFGLFFGDLNAV